jgi:hypothetical protein
MTGKLGSWEGSEEGSVASVVGGGERRRARRE